MNDDRQFGLTAWAKSTGLVDIPADDILEPVSDDASFRRYFRFKRTKAEIVWVDAPPEHEDNESFIKVSAALSEINVSAPRVLASDLDLGYLAVNDLGNRLYLDEMLVDSSSIEQLYTDAEVCLIRLQGVQCDLPAYDRDRLQTEMDLFEEWFLTKQLQIEPDGSVRQMLQHVYALLIESALEQPVRFVHRDFHCRNLMVLEQDNPGVIDFQDAVMGPVTYDLVSLYKDCYYKFPREVVETAVERFRKSLIAAGYLSEEVQEVRMLRWFDLMGAQRHLKCAGIFSRLNLRDGKPRYLSDIPLVLQYLQQVAELYPELHEFGGWLTSDVLPRMERAGFDRETRI